MARPIPHDQHSAILRTLDASGAPLRLEEIATRLGPSVPRRSLQRWLKALVDEHQLAVVGRGPLTAYRLSYRARLMEAGSSSVAEEAPAMETSVPLTMPSREVLEYIRRPLSGRTPVGYDREFLAAYEPNKTSYLSQSVREHLARMGDTGAAERPAGTYGREVLNRLMIDLSWSSSRLEGNTYTLLDTMRLIERGEAARGKEAQETQMILNHKAAIEFLVEGIADVGFDLYTFLNIHGLLSENLMGDDEASGCLRQQIVEIAGSVYKPVGFPQVVEESFRQVLAKAAAIIDPFEQAFFTLVHIPYLQPFEDVNKRVSRLGANIPLLKHNLCPLTFLGVPERSYIDGLLGVYEMTRVELLADVFVWAYERSAREYLAVRKSLRDPDPFRLKYRTEIHELVAQVVRGGEPDPIQQVTEAAKALVPPEDRERLADQIFDDLKRLHEGVLARYRLRPAEFARWQEQTAIRR